MGHVYVGLTHGTLEGAVNNLVETAPQSYK